MSKLTDSPDSLSATAVDKGFRSDIQALRALAVLLVVAYHAHLPGVHGGFLGVDVFFVISGFVITNVLLRERESTSGTSLLDFYARRIRRILPAATVVIIATVFATYHWLSFISGAQAADDAKWVAAFVGNYHFAALGTNYFSRTLPPSTLQQFWSLAIEEQFYLVWPLLFLIIAAISRRDHLRRSLLTSLTVIITGSLTWSIIQTNNNAILAFYSPLTRAWELALGASLAIAAPLMHDRAPRLGKWFRSLGLLAILASVWWVTSATLWPGAASIVPVVGTAVMIAGGTLSASKGYDLLTDHPIVQWIGLISFSLYLVHWPIFAIATEYSSHSLSWGVNLLFVALSIALAAILYFSVESPLRRQPLLVRHRALTYAMGVALIGLTYSAIYWHLAHYG